MSTRVLKMFDWDSGEGKNALRCEKQIRPCLILPHTNRHLYIPFVFLFSSNHQVCICNCSCSMNLWTNLWVARVITAISSSSMDQLGLTSQAKGWWSVYRACGGFVFSLPQKQINTSLIRSLILRVSLSGLLRQSGFDAACGGSHYIFLYLSNKSSALAW